MQCTICNSNFEPTKSNQIYCSLKCQQTAKSRRSHAKRTVNCGYGEKSCPTCNVKFGRRSANQNYCSKVCSKIGFSYKQKKFLDIPSCIEGASRKLDKNLGYVRLYAPMHSEANSWGYVYEHRIIAEQIVGRRLAKDEIVHHKNGRRWDNRPENLEVMNKVEHAKMHGQREEDLDI